MDVCIVTDNPRTRKTCLLAQAFAKHNLEKIVCVPGARVPIIRVWDPEFRLSCDMNVNNLSSIENSRMVQTYMSIDYRARPFILLLKHWAKRRELNHAAGGGTLSSYAWTCLGIFFLQTQNPPVLPVIHKIPHEEQIPVDIDWSVRQEHGSFQDDADILQSFGEQNRESIGYLFYSFFRYMLFQFDYEHSVVSPRHGCILSKASKRWDIGLNNCFCIEDPMCSTRNLANTMDDSSLRGLRLEIQRALTRILDFNTVSEIFQQFEYSTDLHPHQRRQSADRETYNFRASYRRSRSSPRRRFSEDLNGYGTFVAPAWAWQMACPTEYTREELQQFQQYQRLQQLQQFQQFRQMQQMIQLHEQYMICSKQMECPMLYGSETLKQGETPDIYATYPLLDVAEKSLENEEPDNGRFGVDCEFAAQDEDVESNSSLYRSPSTEDFPEPKGCIGSESEQTTAVTAESACECDEQYIGTKTRSTVPSPLECGRAVLAADDRKSYASVVRLDGAAT